MRLFRFARPSPCTRTAARAAYLARGSGARRPGRVAAARRARDLPRCSAAEPFLDPRLRFGERIRQPRAQLVEQLRVQRELGAPFVRIHRRDLRILRGREREPRPMQILVARRHAERVLDALAAAVDPVEHPLQHAHVLAEAGPREAAVRVLAEPVHAVDLRQRRARRRELLAEREPVREIVAHVVAAERQHRERIAPHDALLPRRRGRRLRAHRRRHVHAFDPVARLGDERHRRRAAAAEDECVDRHAARVLPVVVDRRALRRGRREARVRMRGLAARLAADLGRPCVALPIGEPRGRRVGEAFPPDVAVLRERDVREDHVLPERRERVRIGLLARARRDAEIARLRVDRIQPPVAARLEPRDVVADRRHAPALEALRRDQHREVGLAARGRKRRGDVILAALGRGHAEDQHVLGEPAFVAPHRRRDPQREALLAEERVAAVARAEAPDLARLGKMHDVLGRIARPRHILLARRERAPDAVHARHVLAALAERVEHRAPHARHDPHVDDDVGAIRELDADVRDRRAERAHRERHDVQRAAAHRAAKQAVERRAHFGGRDPVIGRARVVAMLAADERAVFDTRDVGRIGQREKRVRPLRRIEAHHRALFDHRVAEAVVLLLRTVAPDNAIRLGQLRDTRDPVDQAAVLHVFGNVDRNGARRRDHVASGHESVSVL
ncbi:hypothetical protein BURPS1710b_1575 [Burkholderia pseudomallei 1710b]|uniref:Uncharacterized protein n=1 Tax=Burkholderia pseudomallei (strain 1710b) TaxID=320372 RepID=Q3JTX5_BURP1|nr:hypothetical protein BURPS1710b_1575 [Burkholderia pseudomallei 1710b]